MVFNMPLSVVFGRSGPLVRGLICCSVWLCFQLPVRADQSAMLAWDATGDPLVAGYRIYYGGISRTYTNSIDLGNVTEAVVTGLSPGVTYYFPRKDDLAAACYLVAIERLDALLTNAAQIGGAKRRFREVFAAMFDWHRGIRRGDQHHISSALGWIIVTGGVVTANPWRHDCAHESKRQSMESFWRRWHGRL